MSYTHLLENGGNFGNNMALPSLKNIGIQIPNYAKPNLDTDLKLEKAPEKKVLESRFLGKVEEGIQKVITPITKKIQSFIPSLKTVRERAEINPIDEQSQIDASFGLAIKKKMGNQLTPEEDILLKEGQKTFAKRTQDLTMGFMGTADMNVVKQLTPVQKVISALKEAKPIRKLQETIYTAERGAKIAKSKAIGAKTSGEAGFYSELGALKGEIPKVQFESLRGKIGQTDIDDIFNQVKNSPLLNDWDKITARQSLVKLFGKSGGRVPTEGELILLNRVFPKEFTQSLLSKKPFVEKAKDAIYQLSNIPRSVMASYDLSAPFRQGAFLLPKQAITHPVRTFKTFIGMFKQFGSEKAFQGLQESIIRRPTFKLMQEGKLALSQMDDILSQREEKFMSSWAEKIPGVRASGRAYTGFLNKIRADVFDDMVKNAERLGLNPSKNKDLLKETGNFVNVGSGRGSLGKLQGAANALNSFFFSPRLMSSRLTLLNPAYYIKASPFVRKEALKSLFAFAGTGLTILGLAKASGLDVGTDPRSSDFLKIKIGNTRVDIGAGFQQYLRIAGQLLTGQYVSSTTGKVITLGEGYKPLTRYDILFRQIESKEAPLFSFATDLLKGQTFAGQEIDLKSEVAQLFIPMVIQSVYDIMKDDPSLLPLSIFGFFGVGLQTYQGKTDIKGAPSLKGGGITIPSLKGAGMVK